MTHITLNVNLTILLNLLGLLLSLIASFMFFTASGVFGTYGHHFKKGFFMLGIGIFIAITIHSVAETLEVFKIIDTNTLFTIMPILLSLGSLFIILGARKVIKAMNQ